MNNNQTLVFILIIILLVGAGIWLFSQGGVTDDRANTPNATTTSTNSGENAPPGSIHNLPVPPAVALARVRAAADLGVDAGSAVVMSAFERDWSDSCLGLGGIAESCLQVITPGYEVTVEANGQTRVYRTNADGSVIREQR